MPAGPATTLRDVARLAEVSIATASRVLNRHPDVSPSARRAVEEAIRRLGYRPDPVLRSLGRYRWPNGRRSSASAIAHLVDRWTSGGRGKADALRARARGLGYRTERILVDRSTDMTALDRRLQDLGVGGIVVDMHGDESRLELPWERFSAVVVGEGQAHLALPRVSADWTQVYDGAVARLRELGCRRIGFVVRRYAGGPLTRELLAAAHGSRGILGARRQPPVLVLGTEREEVRPELGRWMEEHGPEAVVGDGTGHLRSLLELGIEVPARCRYVTTLQGGESIDGLPVSGYSGDLSDRIRRAMDLLHARLLHDERGTVEPGQRLLLACVWCRGRTLGPEPLRTTASA